MGLETVERGAGVHLGIGLCALCGEKGTRGGRRSEAGAGGFDAAADGGLGVGR